jgi:hypothetical protein
MANNSKAKMKITPALRLVLLFLAVLGFAASCYAKNDCPWINEATASGLLGGDAVGEFAAASAGQPAVCAFTQTNAGFTRTLRITVEQTPDTHARLQSAAQACGKDAVSLQAIGNEASMCTLDNRNTGLSELVVGRVRDQLFTITFATTLKNDSVLTRAAMKDKAAAAAEQVAGNLF